MQKIRPDPGHRREYSADALSEQAHTGSGDRRLNLMGIPISKSTYAKLKTNRMNIKVSELLALSQILHCDVGEFFKNLI